MHNKILCSTHCSRPAHTKAWLDKISQCEDVANYKLILCAEPVNDEVISLLNAADFCETEVVVNPKVFGLNLNMRNALERGFSQSDFIIYSESDVLFSRDALVSLDKIGHEYYDSNHPTISLFNRRFHIDRESYNDSFYSNMEEVNKFVAFGFGAWKKQFSPAFNVMCNYDCPSCFEVPNLHYQAFNVSDFSEIKLSDKLYDWIISGHTHFTADVTISNFFAHRKQSHLTFSLGKCINVGMSGVSVHDDSDWWKENVQCDVWADNIKELTCTT